jgi:hypothetical protein
MIQQILQALDAAAAQHLPVAVRHLLTEQQPTGSGIAPHVYVGNGNWNPIANDNAGTFSYWRLMSPIREQEVDAPGCFDAFQATYNLRLVSMIDRDICGDVFDATRAAATAIRNTDDDLRAALKLMLVDFSSGSVEVQSSRVYNQEFGGGLDVNPNKTLVAIDVTISVTGRSSCFEPCTPTPDFFCALIEAKTWSKIKDCMTAGQIADAIEDLCDDAPCDPLSVQVNGEPYATIADPCGGIASVEVVQGDVPVGELIGGQWVVPECPPCDDLTISINADDGVIVVPNPCGESVAIAVTQGGVEVGTWNGTAWIIPECPPCDDLSYSLVNTDDTELESGVVVDPCGASLNLVAPDADVTFDGLPVLSVPSGATGNLDCGSTIESAHVTLGSSSENGIYYISGTAGGKTRYEKNANYAFEYSGTRWVMVRPSTDHQAALGNETYPWLADWTGQSFVVDEGTISQYCGGNVEPCADLTIAINGTTYGTVANPCGATAPVDVHDSNGNDVGSLVSGAWVVAPPSNVLREYNTGGSWSKPTSPSFKGVWVFAAGGGGAGGAGNVNVTNVTGGGGGGGGSISRLWVPAASLLTTETYAIGAGAVSVATGNGGAGGATLFGAHAEAKGGSGGTGGSTSAASVAAGAGGDAALNTPVVNGSSISGGRGGTGARSTSTATDVPAGIISGANLVGSSAAAPGGGGGCGVNAGTQQAGKAGGAAWSTTQTSGGAAGTAGGGNGGNGVSDIYLNPLLGLIASTIGIGTGGGGGGGITTGTAGNGGNGGRAAGGGGGGGTGSGTRGASGAGGDGFIILYEVFAI